MPSHRSLFKKFWKKLGPGLIVGASDDEPSAITTYTIAGAKFGLATLWMALFSLPLMIAIQEMAARIGRVSGHGLAGNLRRYYPRWATVSVAVLVITINTINIGADISGMADAVALVLPLNEKLGAIIMTAVILLTVVILPYQKVFAIFKWLALSLFAYIIASFSFTQDWSLIFKHLFIPHIVPTREFFLITAAFFGTTIAPYLFFWQANHEVEERLIEQCKPGRVCRLKPVSRQELDDLRIDTGIGMTFSNIITVFIIILASSVLLPAGITDIQTISQVAEALRPLAGDYAYLLFMLGILSSGFLAIPILAGSAAYVMAEVFGWQNGLNKTFRKAREFYSVIIGSTIVGLAVPILGINPVKALFYTSLLYGIISPIVILLILHMANNRRVMKEHTNGPMANVLGYIAFTVMTFLGVSIFFLI